MKQQFFIWILCIILSACGLKKPLQAPDAVYPSEPDCECDNATDA